MGIKDRIKGFIQATTEGSKETVTLESLLTGTNVSSSIPGTKNAYQSYDSQVAETYKKYNGQSDFGVAQVRAVIDLRTAMIAGEGVSVAVPNDDKLQSWIEDFLVENKLSKGQGLFKAVKGAEMSGVSLLTIKSKFDQRKGTMVKIARIPFDSKRPIKVVYEDEDFKDEVKQILRKEKDSKTYTPMKGDFVYVQTGGDDSDSFGPTTKIGVVLTDCENYDRAIKDMRRNNHITARVTPVFQTETEQEAATIRAILADTKWKIGKAYAGSAKFSYVSPTGGAHDNLVKEMVSTIKNIVAATSVPVHWMGYTDLMSNRSTADSLYEMIKHGTINERSVWEDSLYTLILKAQELYIDKGGTAITKVNPDFQVRLPLIDFSDFEGRVKALSLAYTDDAISMADYRNALPGIDPLKTKKAVEAENKETEIVPTVDIKENLNQMEEIEDGETDNDE